MQNHKIIGRTIFHAHRFSRYTMILIHITNSVPLRHKRIRVVFIKNGGLKAPVYFFSYSSGRKCFVYLRN